MKGRLLIAAAVLVYLSVLGCMLLPASSPAARASDPDSPRAAPEAVRLEAMPYCGIAMQVQKPWAIPRYLKAIDEIAAEGADSISLVVDSRQENGSSNRIFMDLRSTPSQDQMAQIIEHAKSKKLRVVMMPIVLLDNPRDGEWRGTIKPDVWDEWWDAYRDMIGYYAKLAQKTSVDVLVIGSELVSTEKYADQWERTIKTVRQNYKGAITYSANWDHYASIPFWKDLDLIGMNSYYKLGDNREVPVDQIVARWKEIQKDLFAFEKKVGKPLILLEAGWCSLANSAHEPWDYTQTSVPIDLELQRKLYEGFFRAWWGDPHLGGFMIWEWPLVEGGAEDRGYTPKNKPAERVLKDWFAKSRWTVK